MYIWQKKIRVHKYNKNQSYNNELWYTIYLLFKEVNANTLVLFKKVIEKI